MPAPIDTILRSEFILPMTGEGLLVHDGAIAIDAGKILWVGALDQARDRYVAEREIDAGHSIVLPGFVDVHAHISQTFLRGRQNGVFGSDPFLPFLVTDLLTDELTRIFGLVGCLEALQYGTTTVQTSLTSMSALAEAVARTGIRAVLAEEICDFNYEAAAYGHYIHQPGQAVHQLDRASELFNAWHQTSHGRITAALAPLAADMVLPETYQKVVQFADDHGVMIATHAAQSKEEERRLAAVYATTSIRHLSGLKVLRPSTVLAHCVHADLLEIDLIVKSDTAVAHCPRGFLLDGVIAPLAKWIASGIRVGLGTDDVHHSMWETMRAARYAAAVRGGEPISNYGLLEIATAGGASVLGMAGDVGVIAPGARADLQVISCDRPEMTPAGDLVGNLIECGGSNVVMVLVDGRVVYGSDTETGINIPVELSRAREESRAIWLEIDRRLKSAPST